MINESIPLPNKASVQAALVRMILPRRIEVLHAGPLGDGLVRFTVHTTAGLVFGRTWRECWERTAEAARCVARGGKAQVPTAAEECAFIAYLRRAPALPRTDDTKGFF